MRKDGVKHISCSRNGRKLDKAWQFCEDVMKDMKNLADYLTIEHCGGSRAVHEQIHSMMMKGVVTVELRFKYLKSVP